MKVKHLILILLYIGLNLYFIDAYKLTFIEENGSAIQEKYGVILTILYGIIFLGNCIIALFLGIRVIILIVVIFKGEIKIPFLTKFLNTKIT